MPVAEPFAEPSPSGTTGRWSLPAVAILVTVLVVHGLSVAYLMLPREKATDFFTFYVQSRVPLTGHSPYESNVIDYDQPVFRDGARAHFHSIGIEGEIPPPLKQTFGLFYPPQGYLIFIPFSRIPFHLALAAWMVFLTLAGMACATLSWTTDPACPGRSPTTLALLVGAILLNPLVQLYFGIAQTSLIIAGAAALGLWALRRGHVWLAALLWAFTASKPQLGFEIYLLAAVAGGWRFFARVVVMTVILNAIGGLILSGDPLMILQMSKGGQTHLTSEINRVSNPHVVGWNRVVYALTGKAIEMTPGWILLSHLVWIGALAANAQLRGGLRRPLAYWTAAACCGAVMCGLSHHYDVVVLVLVISYLFWLADRKRWADLAFLLILVAALIFPATLIRSALAHASASEWFSTLIVSYRAFLMVGLAVYLLVRLPPRPALDP